MTDATPQAAPQPRPALPALELPGYALLTFVFLAGPLGHVVGRHWALATAATTLALWTALTRWALRLRPPSRADLPALATAALSLAGLGWYLRTGHNDDAFCHHGFVALIERLGMPAVAPGDPSRVAGYHTAVDALAAAMRGWVPLDVEGRLDLASVGAHGALVLAAVSLLRAVGARPAERALGVLTLVFGAGVYWLTPALPAMQPTGFPWTAHWEGGTYLSVLALSGRRSTVLGFLVAVLTLRLFVGGRTNVGLAEGPGRSTSPVRRRAASWQVAGLLALLAGSASQCADELVLGVVAACALWLLRWGDATAWRRVVGACLTLAPLALAGGGFASAWVSGALGGDTPMGTATGDAALALTWPSWPSFHGPNPPVWRLDGLKVLLLELLPAAAVPWILWRRRALPCAGAETLALWTYGGMLGAMWLRMPALGYDVDLHRLLEPGVALSLALLPWLARVLRPQSALGPALAAAVVIVGPAGRLLGVPGGAHGLWPVTGARGVLLAVTLCLMSAVSAAALGRLIERKGSRSGAALACVLLASAAVLSLALTLGDPRHVASGPPALPAALQTALAPAARTPVLADARLGNLLLRHGHPVVAPWLRSDLEPLDHQRHTRSLRQSAPDAWGGATVFWLTGATFDHIDRAHPGVLRVEGERPGPADPAVWRAWPAMLGPAPVPGRTVWGAVRNDAGRATPPVH